VKGWKITHGVARSRSRAGSLKADISLPAMGMIPKRV